MKSLQYLLLALASTLSAQAIAGDYTQNQATDDAVEQVKQMQPLIGDWNCKRQVLQADGSWQTPEQVSRWEWRYILNGHAVQDYWYPQAEDLSAAGAGTNLRVYDPATKQWKMSWTFDKLGRFQGFDAVFDGKTMVMNGDYPASAQRPAHKAKITFHNISEKHFDWKYESAAPSGATTWQESFRLNCDKI